MVLKLGSPIGIKICVKTEKPKTISDTHCNRWKFTQRTFCYPAVHFLLVCPSILISPVLHLSVGRPMCVCVCVCMDMEISGGDWQSRVAAFHNGATHSPKARCLHPCHFCLRFVVCRRTDENIIILSVAALSLKQRPFLARNICTKHGRRIYTSALCRVKVHYVKNAQFLTCNSRCLSSNMGLQMAFITLQ